MYLIQILLPVYDNQGNAFPGELHAKVRSELTERFGGITAFSRAPAEGVWKGQNTVMHDDILVFEVMIRELDATWWHEYRKNLEAIFRQNAVVIRAQDITLL